MDENVIETSAPAAGYPVTSDKLIAIPFEWGALLEAMPDAVIVSDVEGRIIFANTQFESLLGYARGELIGKPVEALVPASFADVHAGHRHSYYEHPRTRAMGVAADIRARRKDGVEFPVDISLSTVETLRGTVVVSAVRDGTQRKQAEEVARQHARVAAVTTDRERLGKGLLDGVVRELFETAIGLQGTMASLNGNHALVDRMQKSVDQLDQAINDIRNHVFGLADKDG